MNRRIDPVRRTVSLAVALAVTLLVREPWARAQQAPLPSARAPTASLARGGLVVADVVGLRSLRGRVLCAMFRSARGWPGEARRAFAHATAPIRHGRGRCEFRGVPPGGYAVIVLHDEDANGTMTTSTLGLPEEGWGVSNDADGPFGPRPFERARFRHEGTERTSIRIRVRYL